MQKSVTLLFVRRNCPRRFQPLCPKGGAMPRRGKEVLRPVQRLPQLDTTEVKMGPGLKGLFKRAKMTSGEPMSEANVLIQINEGGNGMPATGTSFPTRRRPT